MPRILIRTLIMVSLSLPYVVSVATAATIRVPSEQPTIQAGIDASVDGDTVLAADGIYTGEDNRDIDFMGKRITVRSVNGSESTVVDCERKGRGFFFKLGGVTVTA